ncbi:helix-turn-helix transcriptional regulator [Streptococcus pneumoniae]
MEYKQIEMREYIGKRVRKLRLEKGITQESLAEKAGLAHNYIYRVENQHLNIKADTIDKLIEALDVTPAEFFDFPPLSTNTGLANLIRVMDELSDSQKNKVVEGVSMILEGIKK